MTEWERQYENCRINVPPKKKSSNTIKERVACIHKRILQIETDYQLKMDRAVLALDKTQLECDHPNQTRTPDPSGGNDPCYRCEDCGKESNQRLT